MKFKFMNYFYGKWLVPFWISVNNVLTNYFFFCHSVVFDF